MGKILYINAISKPKGASENRPSNNPFQKYTFQFAENDKYIDYFSVGGWLNKRKEGGKHRTKR